MLEACPSRVVDDIEDLVKAHGPPHREHEIVPRVARRREREAAVGDSFIPGSCAIYVKTWGCAHNSSDSEYMAGQLAAKGYAIVDDAEKADLWLLNSCTVKNPAEDHFKHQIELGRKRGKKIVVAGCVSQATPHVGYLEGLGILGVQQTDRVVDVVEETLKGNSVRLLGTKRTGKHKAGGASLALPKIRRNPLVEILAVSTGCLNHCTYCKTKHARGDLGSYPVEELVDRARQAFEEGVREIWLTSEDTGAYGRDVGTTLPELLRRMVAVVPEGCMLRLGMTNPPYILDYLEEVAEILAHPRVYSFLHVPVQSGSDPVLLEMKREYTVAEFKRVVDYLREKVPGITIATDVICGFPTETEEDFRETLKLVEEYKFPSLFTNQFYPRPGTVAAKMKRLPTNVVKDRTKRLTDLFRSYRPYDHKVGEKQTVLVTEVAHDRKHLVGHNKFYEQVLLPMDERYMGKLVEVKISSAGKHYMHCEVLGTAGSLLPAPLPKGRVSEKRNSDASPRRRSAQRWASVAVVALLALLARLFLAGIKI